jgi:preprotein translocase subunit SecF
MSEVQAAREPMRVINFMGLRTYGAAFSIIVMVISLASIAVRGLNFGLDFTGGTLVEVEFAQAVVPEEVRLTLTNAGVHDAVVQLFGSERDVLIRVPPQKGESEALLADHLRAALTANFPGVELRRSEFVGPAVGAELRETGGLAMLVALAAVMVYMMFRFTSKFGIGAVVALIHDVVVTIGAFSVFQWTFDLPALAAVLAVIGYSVNDTVVVADRIRENFRKLRKGTPLEIINLSLTQTLDRTIMTSFTTLLVVVALFLFGGESVRSFSIALIVGIVFGTYSSTYVAAGIVYFMGNTREDLMVPEKENARNDAP